MSLIEHPSPDGPTPQSAALPYRIRDGRVEILLVTPRGGSGWIIPKGKVNARLGPARSAAREAEEEGGVHGSIDRAPFGEYRHGGGGDGPRVAVFLMHVTRELTSWPEAHQRERRWAGVDEVPGLVVDPALAQVLHAAAEHLSTHAPALLAAEDARRARSRQRRLAGSALLLAAAFGAAVLTFLVV
jgi:predicted NUDIX family NTP pyrophosphohydrolase